MALKLNIRWQLALVSVALSLLPIAVVGILAYRIARDALEERIRFNLETLAVQSDEKLERLLLDHHQNLAVWSQLGFIRDDAVTGDADGRILQFLQEAKRNTDVAQEFWVANAAGTVIASTMPSLRGREVGDREFLQAARRGESWVGSPTMQDLTGRVGHAARVSAAGELRSLEAGRRARGRARLAEDRRRFSRRCACCPKGRTSADISCWPIRRARFSRRRRSSPAGSRAGRG